MRPVTISLQHAPGHLDSLCNFTPNFANDKISVNTSSVPVSADLFGKYHRRIFSLQRGKFSEKLFTVFKLKCKSVAVFSLGQF